MGKIAVVSLTIDPMSPSTLYAGTNGGGAFAIGPGPFRSYLALGAL